MDDLTKARWAHYSPYFMIAGFLFVLGCWFISTLGSDPPKWDGCSHGLACYSAVLSGTASDCAEVKAYKAASATYNWKVAIGIGCWIVMIVVLCGALAMDPSLSAEAKIALIGGSVAAGLAAGAAVSKNIRQRES
jgi:hypothetical protein